MIIHIDESIKDNWTAISKSQDLLQCIELLARCAIEGNHMIVSKRSVFEILKSSDNLSQSQKNIFRFLHKKVYEIHSIIDKVCVYVNVYYSENVENKVIRKEDGSKVIYNVHLEYFDSSKKICEAGLLCENLNDCKFYKFIAQEYIKKHSKLNGEVKFDFISGGGDTSVNCYRNKLDNGSMCIAVLDSDKKSKSTITLGTTAKKVEAVFAEKKQSTLADFYPLEVREMENLLPPTIYDLISQCRSKELICTTTTLIQLYEFQSDYYFFGDVKGGVEIKNNPNIETFYNNLSHELRQALSKKLPISEDGTPKRLHNTKHLFEIFMKSYVDKLPEDTIPQGERLTNETKDNISQVISELPNEFARYWDKIGERLFSWGCSYLPKTVKTKSSSNQTINNAVTEKELQLT